MSTAITHLDITPEMDFTAPAAPVAPEATERQVSYATALLKEFLALAPRLGEEPQIIASALSEQSAWEQAMSTKRSASKMIDTLLGLLRSARKDLDAQPAAPEVEEAPEGMHRTADGTIYKVQRAVRGSGRLYAKRLVRIHAGRCAGHLRKDDPSAFDAPLLYHSKPEECSQWIAGEYRFEYAPGAIRRLSSDTRLSLEEAREWGVLYGTCVVCGRTLTDEASIAAGIGPICGKRF